MKQTLIAGLTVLLLSSVPAPATAAKESERLGYRTYREEAGGVTVLADATLAALDPKSSYVAMAVAVRLAARTPNATITRESFSLIDAAGNRVPSVGAMEIRERHGKVEFDAKVMRSQGMAIGEQFSGDIEVPSRFYGDRNDIGVVQDRVNLAPSSWFRDIIYFPRPPGGLGGTLTLRVEGDGLPAPIEVRLPLLDGKRTQ